MSQSLHDLYSEMTYNEAKRYLDNYPDNYDKAKIISLMKLYCRDRQTIRWVRMYYDRIKRETVRCACGRRFFVENILKHETSISHLRNMIKMNR